MKRILMAAALAAASSWASAATAEASLWEPTFSVTDLRPDDGIAAEYERGPLFGVSGAADNYSEGNATSGDGFAATRGPGGSAYSWQAVAMGDYTLTPYSSITASDVIFASLSESTFAGETGEVRVRADIHWNETDGSDAFSRTLTFGETFSDTVQLTLVNDSPLSRTFWWSSGYDMSLTAPVPEPETYALMAVGLGMLAWVTRRQRARKH